MQLDPSHLSKLLQGKRAPSEKILERLSQQLKQHNPGLAADFSQVLRRTPSNRLLHVKSGHFFEQLLHWQNTALAELLKLKKQRWTLSQLVRAMGLDPVTVQKSLEALESIGMASQHRGAKGQVHWLPSKRSVATDGSRDIQLNPIFMEYQKDLLGKGISAIDLVSPEERSQSAVVFGLKKSKIPEVLKDIRAFRRKMWKKLDAHAENDDVYVLSISLAPMTRTEKG